MKRLTVELKALIKGEKDFLVFEIDNARNIYFQFSIDDTGGSNSIRMECVGNAYLSPSDQLSPSQIEVLNKKGFLITEDSDGNYSYSFEGNSDAVIATICDVAKEIARDVYGS